ncbi:MAG: guanine deaminase, partial [Ruminococcaceae bacterium]|nr:guanine deaminase [Oscillospiraceae bacterium]
MNFVIKGSICHSVTPKEIGITRGYAVCENGISRGVFETLPERYAGLPVHDFTGKLVMPGMVDLHIHGAQFAYRGTGFDLELLDWLDSHAFPEEARFADEDYAHRAYTIFADAMKMSATTRAAVFASRHGRATEILMEKLEASGIVSYVGKVNMDRDAPDPLREADADASAADTVQWIERTQHRFSRTYPILTPRFIPSCTDALMEKLGEIQRKYHLPIQSHVSENQGEIGLVKQLRPDAAYYGDAYDRHGLFGRNPVTGEAVPTLMAHCVWSPDAEIEKMREQSVFVVHCPASNFNVSSGIAPIRRYLEAGLKLGLGSDVAGGQSESMLRAVTDAVQMSKMY